MTARLFLNVIHHDSFARIVWISECVRSVTTKTIKIVRKVFAALFEIPFEVEAVMLKLFEMLFLGEITTNVTTLATLVCTLLLRTDTRIV